MNFSAVFIRRPVATTLVMLGVLFFGLIAYRLLPVNDLPNVDFPTIQVSAGLPGASPETMAAAVATPLERQLSAIPGLDSMSSSSSLGSTQITLQFDLERDIDAAAQDVQTAIATAASQLPPGLPTPPSYRKVNPAEQPIMILSLNSPTLPLSRVDEYAQTLIAQRISMVSGVAQVLVFGAQKYAVRVQVDPNALAARGIGLDEVESAIRTGNTNLPTGYVDGKYRAFTIESDGQLLNAAAFRPLVVAYRNGSPVRLEQLGKVIDSVENDKVAGWYNGTRSITLGVQRQPGVNTIAVVDAIEALLPTFRSQIPGAVNLDIVFDRSESIRHSVEDVQFTLVLAIGLVVLVIFLFLRNLSATIIPSLAVPLSLVATFAVMYLLGFSLNNLSLMALTLSVGFVVDDAIVVLENIVRRQEMGESPMEAAFTGSREITFTIISMTLSLVAVFLPVLFMGGILGRLFNEFAITIATAILVSGFVSLTLTPMLCSRFLRAESVHPSSRSRLYQISEGAFDALTRAYDRSLQWVLRHRVLTMLASTAVLAATVYLFNAIPKGFIPSEDNGQIIVTTEAAQGISFADMARKQQQVVAVLRQDPAIDGTNASVGSGGPAGASNAGRVFVRLKPRSERDSAQDVIQRLRPKLAQVTGIRVFMQQPPAIRIGGQQSKSLYQYTLQSTDTAELYRYTPMLEAKLREVPQLQDVTSDVQLKNPQINLMIDRDKASSLGITAEQIERTLSNAYSSRQISLIYAPTNQYRVILSVDPQYQQDPEALSLLYVRSTGGRLVPLSALAKLTPGVGPLSVNHLGQFTATTISFNLKPGVALSEASAIIERLAAETLPDTIATSFQGNAEAFQSSTQNLGLLLAVAILVIYLVLGILYESFIHPLTILSGLPSAGFGALLTLMLFGFDLDVYGFVGLLLLVGIVKKNAIIMIDFALEAQRKDGKRPEDAIYAAALVRFRPIMMTTVSAIAGAIPIAIGFGAGAETRQPLGLAVVGGLLFSQWLTLYITPVIYLYLDRLQERFSWGKNVRPAPAGPVPDGQFAE
ncbi:efflux RND transporter permease subunit [Gloeobacter morelensis]|uniref:Multidrug efflux RND transporter permease subunit n=1 Tax=Gloeobacter morelensis MG652769 TaxID=2781736 RepID=A0ABY3PN50_9CYAN|nr:multidrug efflux RND transporter permease subunit [Gloeobacter morelensis]UFP95128.1 multidrug efflux RND transporter permease subunit [Gloeobacter morelensis MG652769]